jgi:hypothetical protein
MAPLIIGIGAIVLAIYILVKNWRNLNGVQKGIIIGLGVLIGIVFVIIIVIKLWSIYQIILNGTLTANPIGLIIMAIGLLILAIILLVIYYKEIIKYTKELWDKYKGILMIIFPMVAGFVFMIEIIRALIRYWGQIKEAFKTEGMVGGILAIGKAILSGILAPIQSLFELLSKIPKIGEKMKDISANIYEFRQGMFEPQSPTSAYERSTYTKEEKTTKGELTIKDQTGMGELKPKFNYGGFNINLKKSGVFGWLGKTE